MSKDLAWLASDPGKWVLTIFVLLAVIGLACLIQNAVDKRRK